MPQINPDTGKTAPTKVKPKTSGSTTKDGAKDGKKDGGATKFPKLPKPKLPDLTLNPIEIAPYTPGEVAPIDFGSFGFPTQMTAEEMQQAAQNQVYQSLAPILDALAAQEVASTQQYDQRRGQVGSIYDALNSQLTALSGAYAPQADAVRSDYLASLGDVAGLFGGTTGAMPASEVAAAQAVGQSSANAMMGLLADAQQRDISYNNSAIRQGGIENVVAQRNLAQQLQSVLDSIGTQRSQYERDSLSQVQNALQTMRDQQNQYLMQQAQLQVQAMLQQQQMAQSASQFGADYGLQAAQLAANQDIAQKQLALQLQTLKQDARTNQALQGYYMGMTGITPKPKKKKKTKKGGK